MSAESAIHSLTLATGFFFAFCFCTPQLAIEVGAEDDVVQPDGVMLICDKAADVQVTVMDALEAAGVEYDEAQVRSMPIVSYPLEGAAADELAAALEALVGHPSISAVTTNVDLTS
jgi:transcriptional/translational regulatory protein YebC/TACO1